MTGLALRSRRASGLRFTGLNETKGSRVRRDIQGLRAFAVISVILDHVLHWPQGGFIGVDIFFVISGFVITESLLREHSRTGRISFGNFYRRRIKRIFPASALVLIVTVAISYLTFNEAHFLSIAWDAFWALLSFANWHFAVVGTDYFQASGPVSPLQHYWSLAVEEQFYLLWPCIIATALFIGGRSQKRHGKIFLAGAAILIICIASFAWAMLDTSNSPTVAYFSTFSRAWELGVGASLAVLSPLFVKLPHWMRPLLAWSGVAGMVFALLVVDGNMHFPAPSAALPVFSAAVFIIAGTGSNVSPSLFLFTNPLSSYVGDISYSLYLWHFPVVVLAAALMDLSILYYVVVIAATFIIAIYSYHLLEDPIRKSAWLSGEKRRERLSFAQSYKLTALSLLAIVTSCVVAAALIPPKPSQLTIVSSPNVNSEGDSKAAEPELSALQNEIQASLAAADWPTLTPSLEEVIAGPQAPEEIGVCGRSAVDEMLCSWGDPNASRTILTVGNSTSMAYIAALRSAIGTTDGWRIVSYGMFGCPFGTSESLKTLKILPEGCQERASQAIEAINRIKPDVVIASGVYDTAADLLNGVAVPRKVVFLPGPPVDKNVAECYTKLSTPADCVSTVSQNWAATEKALAMSLPNAVFIDSVPWFCQQGLCPSFVGTIPTKLDATHITAAYAERLAPVIRESFQKNGIL